MIGMTIYGFGQGMAAPTLLAWATDMSDEHHKGRGLASLYIAMELGIGAGALISAWIFANDPLNFARTFLTCSVLAILAFIFLIFLKSFKRNSV
jgi:predicted MFS family arabinose efflux permease